MYVHDVDLGPLSWTKREQLSVAIKYHERKLDGLLP